MICKKASLASFFLMFFFFSSLALGIEGETTTATTTATEMENRLDPGFPLHFFHHLQRILEQDKEKVLQWDLLKLEGLAARELQKKRQLWQRYFRYLKACHGELIKDTPPFFCYKILSEWPQSPLKSHPIRERRRGKEGGKEGWKERKGPNPGWEKAGEKEREALLSLQQELEAWCQKRRFVYKKLWHKKGFLFKKNLFPSSGWTSPCLSKLHGEYKKWLYRREISPL